jgi:hypothetical protein
MTGLPYFSQPGSMTDPGSQVGMLEGLPSGIADLCRLVQGTTIHTFWAERYGICLQPERQEEVQLRSLDHRLKRMKELDPRPLTEARPLPQRIVGNCRDFTLLLVSILRHQGVPARARCGFGAYFLPVHYEDHWVCEYWNATLGSWVLVDAQLDSFQCDQLKIRFDPLDVPRDQFIVGGKAWQMARGGDADPESFGIFDMHGLGFIRGNLVRDVAALNKVELLPWDCWGIIEAPEPISSEEMTFLDQLAELTYDDVPDFDAVQRLYNCDRRLRMDGTIHSYVKGGVLTINIARG